jgi:hypothetical protein
MNDMESLNDMFSPGRNYIGSSGYGTLPNGLYGNMPTTPNYNVQQPLEYAVYDVSQNKVVSNRTRKPFTGKDPRTGQSYVNGVASAASAESAQPMDPNQRYRALDVVKAPDIASAQTDMMAAFKKTADASLKPFSEHLGNFNADLESARSAGKEATNIQPTVNALVGAQQKYAADLGSSNDSYQKALADAAAASRGIVKSADNTLPMYDAAANNLQNIAIANANRYASRYQLGSGTPSSPSSYMEALRMQKVAEAAAPFEMAKIDRRFSNLSNYALPVEQQIAGQNINYVGNYLPGIAGSNYNSAVQTANAIQSLKNSVSGMSYDNAIRYMQALGIPSDLMQRVFSNQLGQLGQLAQLGEMSHYRGLEDTNPMSVSQPVYYNMGLPGYPKTPVRQPQRNTPQQSSIPNQPSDNYGNTGLDQYGRGIQYNPIQQNGTVAPSGMSWDDYYYLYGMTPEDVSYLNGGGGGEYRTPNTGTGYYNVDGNVPEWAAGGVNGYNG